MDLTAQVNKILMEYADDVDKAMVEVEDKVAKEAIKRLKATSPKNKKNGGHKHYSDTWKIDTRNKKLYAHTIIYNSQYQLTHLLENGHNIVSGGRVVGHATAKPHIKAVETWVGNEIEKELRRELS